MPKLKTYGVAFAPRSGSTWLTDVVQQSRLLGKPGEYFNTDIAKKMIERSQSNNFGEYLDYLKRDYHTNNVFGFEISWPWMHKVIEDGNHHHLEKLDGWFFLRRHDFVLQAVSLDKALRSGVFHRRDEHTQKVEYSFDSSAIARQILHVMYNEFFFNRYFHERNIMPVELWYENMTTQNPASLIKAMARELDVIVGVEEEKRLLAIDPELKKMGNEQNIEFAKKFRDQQHEFVDYWESNRGQVPVARFKRTFKTSLEL
ncbi:Stf0 family sulfotransferase [Congregibacter sp.]|uniref:Stf0 family sulfotransferase n=1 Tax=Congregibacter sp. TaxID=2744308 RepID=UPI003F6AF2B9